MDRDPEMEAALILDVAGQNYHIILPSDIKFLETGFSRAVCRRCGALAETNYPGLNQNGRVKRGYLRMGNVFRRQCPAPEGSRSAFPNDQNRFRWG